MRFCPNGGMHSSGAMNQQLQCFSGAAVPLLRRVHNFLSILAIDPCVQAWGYHTNKRLIRDHAGKPSIFFVCTLHSS